MDEQQIQSDDKAKKFVLRNVEPILVPTTLGQMNVRHTSMKDFKKFSPVLDKGEAAAERDFQELGKLALLTLVFAPGDAGQTPVLTEEGFMSLTPDDMVALVKAIVVACRLEASSNIDNLEALGRALFASLSKVAKQIADTAASIQKSIDSSFRTLSDTLKVDLGNKFSGLSAARNAMNASAASLGRAQSIRAAMLGTVSDALKVHTSTEIPSARATINLERFSPPKFLETEAGRTAARAALASEESAKQLNEVAGHMGMMTEQMAAIQTVFLREVLPKWNADLQDSADATNNTLSQAKSSLFWAKWALVASVVVTIVMTAWQVWQAGEYQRESDKQQARAERLMTEQLKAVQELNKQLEKLAQQNDVSREAAHRRAGALDNSATTGNGRAKKN